MDLQEIFKQYWPFLALLLWLSSKWWNSRKIVAMLPELRKKGATIIDVRSAAEFSNANAPGTINIPLPELGKRLDEVARTAPVVLCCASGTRSGLATLLLKKNGFGEVHNIGTWTKLLD